MSKTGTSAEPAAKRRRVTQASAVKLEYEEPKPTDTNGTGEDPKAPIHWREHYDNIAEMRKNRDAPVDTMGCASLADSAVEPRVRRFQTLVALMLSSQTKDETTYAAMKRLQAHGLSPESIRDTDEATLQGLIYPVGFYRNKTSALCLTADTCVSCSSRRDRSGFLRKLHAEYITAAAEKILEDYDGDIPSTVKGLTSLKGVGPKMAYLAMSSAWNNPVGIGVDVHVHRIANRLGWVKTEKQGPEGTRNSLEEWLPRSLWTDINWLWVGFGQTVCLPVKPLCGECLNQRICPTGRRWKPDPEGSPSRAPRRTSAFPEGSERKAARGNRIAEVGGGSSARGEQTERTGGSSARGEQAERTGGSSARGEQAERTGGRSARGEQAERTGGARATEPIAARTRQKNSTS